MSSSCITCTNSLDDLLIRQMLDVMHCEKNVCDNMLRTLMGEKDSAAVRLDMQMRGIRPQLWLQQRGRSNDRYWLPDAPYVLTREEKQEFLESMRNIKTPSGYVSSLSTKISGGKFRALKSHDYHILMQQLMPVCLRTFGEKRIVGAIMRLSKVFQRLCVKAVDVNNEAQLMLDVAETVSILERECPPSFFDITVHLVLHLVEELYMCGPVQTRWMYPYERYFKGLKGFVRNLAKPEGSVVQGYQVEEALGFVTEYMTEYNPTSRRVWDSKEDPSMTDEIMEGKGTIRKLSDELRKWMHAFVLENASQLQAFRNRYEVYQERLTAQRRRFRSINPRRRGQRQVAYPAHLVGLKPFFLWLQEEVNGAVANGEEVKADVLCLSRLPSDLATKYRSMWAFGNHLRVLIAEEHLKTCDSGVAAVFRRPWRSGARDRNLVVADVEYVGDLEEIVELNYGGLCVVVLLCSWVKAIYKGNNPSVKKDKWGFTLANFDRRVPYGTEAFAFPMHVEQVFFAEAREAPGWKVVLRKDVRGRRVVGNGVAVDESGLFALGDDEDHEGFRVPPIMPEENDRQLPSGRTLRREDAIAECLREEPESDPELGDSGSSSNEED